jgi:hypothetical protein
MMSNAHSRTICSLLVFGMVRPRSGVGCRELGKLRE